MPHTYLTGTCGFFYTSLRRRRPSSPIPTNATPRITSEAGFGKEKAFVMLDASALQHVGVTPLRCSFCVIFHNLRYAPKKCKRKVQMTPLCKVEMALPG